MTEYLEILYKEDDLNHLKNHIDNFKILTPVKDKVGVKGEGDIFLPEIRKSSSINNIIIENSFWEKYNELFSQVGINNNSICEKFSLHEYKVGDYFKPHKDSKKNINDIGTFLLIPPKFISNHTGGILQIKNEDIYTNKCKKMIYDTERSIEKKSKKINSELPKIEISADDIFWKIVVFGFNVEHEVTPILSGNRFVFKSNIVNNIISDETIILPFDEEKEEYLTRKTSKINKLKDKIKRLEEETTQIVEKNIFSKVNKVIAFIDDEISFGWDHVYIILKSSPPNKICLSEDDIHGDDVLIFNAVKNKYHNVTIKRMMLEAFSKNFKKFKNDQDDKFKLEDENFGSYLYPYKVAPEKNVCKESIYNDEGGYRVISWDYEVIYLDIKC